MNYRNKETPFEIKSEEEWENVKVGWWVSYICNKCGERHKKVIGNNSRKINICLKKIPYYNKETPFEIQSEEDWKKVKAGWYVSYICNECGKKHVKKVCELKYIKKRTLNDITKISSDITRFVGGFGLNTVNVVGLSIKLLTVFLDIGIITRNFLKNKKEDKNIDKYVEFLNNFYQEIECSNDLEKERRMEIYMDVLGDDFSNVKQIRDINNRKDYIKKCLKRDKLY